MAPNDPSNPPGPPPYRERAVPDRRKRPTRPWDALRFNRRTGQRRAEELRKPHFVDHVSRRSAFLALLILALSTVDAVATLVLLDSGCEEINPLMLLLLQCGPVAFLAGKLAMTAAAVPVFLVRQHHRLFESGVRVAHVPPLLIGIYGALIAYEIALMFLA